MSLELVGLIALLAALPAMILFVGFYMARSNWRKYSAGRALMYTTLALMLTWLWVTVRLGLSLTGHLPEKDTLPWILLRVGLFGAISASQWRLLIVLLKTQGRKRAAADEQAALTAETKHGYL